MSIDTTKLRELAQSEWAKASGKWALLEAAADDLDKAKGMLKAYNNLLVEIADVLDIAPYHLTEITAFEKIRKLRTIEAAARNLAKVKGRHHSEQAMNQLLEALK